jgi:hypothetical protein
MRAKRVIAFWQNVDQSAGPEACWPWTGSRKDSGYGRLCFDRHQQNAHRVAYQLATGHDPGDLIVCHSCDNPPCCNPAHLWVGTHGDNARDKVAKGRWNGNRGGNGYQHRTHCKHGHEFTPENTLIVVKAGRPCRQCRACNNRHGQEFRQRRALKRRQVAQAA